MAAGDIHKRQEIKRGDVKIVYPGSLIQQTFGETVTQHGFAVWDLEKKTHHNLSKKVSQRSPYAINCY